MADVTETVSPSGWSKFFAALAQISTAGAPFLYVPLILFRWPGRRDSFVRRQAGAAFDFQLVAMATYLVLGGLFAAVLFIPQTTPNGWIIVGLFALYVIWYVGVWVFAIRGAIRAASGRDPGYPDTWHVLRDRTWPRHEQQG